MPDLLPIREIKAKMQDWSCKIIVQEKVQVTTSVTTPTKKQKYGFIDSEGSKFEGIIFNADIPKMSPMLQDYRKYLISNAGVRDIPLDYQTPDLKIQWVIGSRTVVEELNDAEDIVPFKFNYTAFKDLVQYMDQKDKSVDVLAIVIHALEEKTVKRNYKDAIVQKFVLVNEDLQPINLSMWDDFVSNEGQQIVQTIHSNPVVICRMLRVVSFNGVALSTWFDSAILVDPPVAMRNVRSLSEIVDRGQYNRFNPDISLKSDQKVTLIANVGPAHKTAWVKALFSFEHISRSTGI